MPVNPNIRLSEIDPADRVQVTTTEDQEPQQELAPDDSPLLEIEHEDGTITISMNGKSLAEPGGPPEDRGWFANLVEKIDNDEVARIADDLLRGIEDDLASRKEWIEDRAAGIRLLALKVEQPGSQSADGAPVEGMSRVRHPLLLEAVLRFQANARAEMLPTDGPVKVRDDSNTWDAARSELAEAFQKDFNHYLTATANEYVPDTDKMFFKLGFGGIAFKKVYHDPLKNRPVSLTVDADDLIVNNAAVSLDTAKRVTHRLNMKPSTVKRLQIIGHYRDVDLPDPGFSNNTDSVKQAEADQQGIDISGSRAEDRNRQLYECYCELDIRGFEHKYKGKQSGLEIPYIVTIDRESREVLSVVRNYDEDTAELPEARKVFVQYDFVPGLGFYGIGLLHILGNTTSAVTAAWRELLDSGMFASFPGFLIADSGLRQDTTVFRVPPGAGAKVNTGGQKIGDAIMPLPYKEPSPALMNLTQNIVETGQRVGGTSEMQVGEGRQDAPVGTTLALIEQAVKILNSVHKRMHTAQDQEFQLIKECFRQNPESFWKGNRKAATQWDEAKFLKALDDYDLVPRADPNTASHAQRLMKAQAVKMLAGGSPDLYDNEKVDTFVLQSIGISNPEQFFKPEQMRNQAPPELLKGIEDIKIAHQKADADTLKAQAAMVKAQQPNAPSQVNPPPDKGPELQLKMAEIQLKAQQMKSQDERARVQDENRDKDREKDLTMEELRVQQSMQQDEARRRHDHDMMAIDAENDAIKQARDLAAKIKLAKETRKDG